MNQEQREKLRDRLDVARAQIAPGLTIEPGLTNLVRLALDILDVLLDDQETE